MDDQANAAKIVTQSKPDENNQHSLGLHDLYKAAFSEEFKNKTDPETFQIYSMKPLDFSDSNVGCYVENVPVDSYEEYDNNENNSVLDLDKGVAVKVEKNADAKYSCDNHLLQRYLQDASMSLMDGPSNNASAPADYLKKYADESFTLATSNNARSSKSASRAKVEECDFNSSDSFASTESIIPKTIKCPQCPKQFMFKADLTRHSRRKHATKPKLTCPKCSKEFNCQQHLLFHEKCHKKNPNLCCHLCMVDFKSTSSFSKHMEEVHQTTNPFRCSLCNKAYRRVTELNTHRKKHHNSCSSEEGNCVCTTCEKSFEKKKHLNSHIKSHVDSSATQFECACGKTFKKAFNFNKHNKKHHPPPPYASSLGNTTVEFVISGGNPVQKIYKCAQCSEAFTQDNEYNNHMAFHASSLMECPSTFGTPPTELTQPNSTNKKKRKKKFNCPTCEQEFNTKKAMMHHASVEHKPSTQEICTQTELFELQNVDLSAQAGCLQPQPMFALTPLTINFNTVPLIVSAPSAVPVPYSVSS